MIRTSLAALAGASLLLSSPLFGRTVDDPISEPSDIYSLAWPSNFDSNFQKLRSAALFERGSVELLVLAGSTLYLVRDPMTAPAIKQVATNVSDFAVLPEKLGVSRVAIVSANGLEISSAAELASDPTIEFALANDGEAWKYATCIDAAADSSGAAVIAAGIGSIVRHAQYLTGAVSASTTITVGQVVSQVAVADASSAAGLEIAVVTTGGVQCFEGNGARYRAVSSAYPVQHLSRIPNGADVRDSFGFTIHYTTYDTFHELVGLDLSDPLYSAQFGLGDLIFAPLGLSDTRADLIFSDTNSPTIVALHGQPQGPTTAFPFYWDLSGWSLFDISEDTLPNAPVVPRLGAGDFDGDGDIDLAMAGEVDEFVGYIVFKRGLGNDPVATLVSIGAGEGIDTLIGSPEVEVHFTANVPQPAAFEGVQTGRIRVRVYLREYSATNVETSIPSQFAAEEFFYVTPLASGPYVGPYPTAVDFPLVDLAAFDPNLGSDNTLLYFEIVPQLYDPVTFGTLQRGNATIWVGSANEDLIHLLCCVEEPDEFSICNDGAPWISETHRRKVLRPIQTSPAGGGGGN